MYIPQPFRETRPEVLNEIIRQHSFATLVSRLEGELIATHLPILLDESRGPNGTLMAHMARANPHWHAFAQRAESLAIFVGPHAYISPGWYSSEVAVPTWNYAAVHAYGVVSLLEDPARVRDLLEATVGTFESGFAAPWSTARIPEDYVTNLARGIVAFEMPIEKIEGKRKLSQNRPVTDAEGAAAGLRAQGDPVGLQVAELMTDVTAARRARTETD